MSQLRHDSDTMAVTIHDRLRQTEKPRRDRIVWTESEQAYADGKQLIL